MVAVAAGRAVALDWVARAPNRAVDADRPTVKPKKRGLLSRAVNYRYVKAMGSRDETNGG